MARRIVMIGPSYKHATQGEGTVAKLRAAEVNPSDASAFVDSGDWRVSLTLFTGALADATVIFTTKQTWQEHADQWRGLLRLSTSAKEFHLELPLVVG